MTGFSFLFRKKKGTIFTSSPPVCVVFPFSFRKVNQLYAAGVSHLSQECFLSLVQFKPTAD